MSAIGESGRSHPGSAQQGYGHFNLYVLWSLVYFELGEN